MEYVIKVSDIIKVAKKQKKVIIACIVVFVSLSLIYVVMQNKQAPQVEDNTTIEKQKEIQSTYDKAKPLAEENTQENVAAAYEMINENPILNVDFANVCTSNITITFDGGQKGSRVETIKSWIGKLSCKELFGTEDSNLKAYRKEFVYVYGDVGEVVVSILDNKKYDMKGVSKRLSKHIESEAKKNQVKLLTCETTISKGFDQKIIERQTIAIEYVSDLLALASGVEKYRVNAASEVGKSGMLSKKNIVIILAGLLFGLIAGLVIVSFNVIRRQIILNPKQIEDSFGLEKITEGTFDEDNYSKEIDAYVDYFDESAEEVLLTDPEGNSIYNTIVEKLCEKSQRKYLYITIYDDEIRVLKYIKNASKIIIPVSLGKTTYEDVKQAIKWSRKYKKEILGFIAVHK